MESTATRQLLKSQYFTFHKSRGINGSRAGQSQTLEKLTDDAIFYLNSVTFKKRFSKLNFKQLLDDALKEFRNQDHSVIENHIIVGVKNLEKYGLNLSLYPWRKEFLLLKLHSGFFKCNVEIHFKPAKEVLEMFGYKEISSQELTIVDSLNPKHSQSELQLVVDKIQEIVFELFLMSVELAQLIPVLQIADKEGYSLEDALKSRRRTSGDVKEALRWLEMNARKSSAPKRTKYDVLDNIESLNEDCTKQKGSRKKDGTNENEDDEHILLRHQQNLEKHGARTRDLKYPPGTKIESGSAPTARQHYALEIPHNQQHEMVGPHELGNGIVTDGHGAGVRGPFIGFDMVQSEFDDAELYGHVENMPAADQSLQKRDIKLQPIPNVTTPHAQIFGHSAGDYVSMESFLNSNGGTHQKPTAEPPLNCASGNTGAVLPASTLRDSSDVGDYVFIDDICTQSVVKTEKPCQYPGLAMRMNSNENFSTRSKSYQRENNEVQGEMKEEKQKDEAKDNLHLLMKDCLNIQQSATHSASSAATNITDHSVSNSTDQWDKMSRHSGSDLAPSGAKNIGKQSGSADLRIYSIFQEQKRTTAINYSERNYNSDPSLINCFRDQVQSAASSAKISTVVSSSSSTGLAVYSTAQHNTQPSQTISAAYQNFNSDSENVKNDLSQVSTSTSCLTTSSSVKSTASSGGDTTMTVKLPPIAKEKNYIHKGSGTNVQRQSDIQGSTITPASQQPLCDHCQLKGSSICDNCFIIVCDSCQEIFDSDLCPKSKEGRRKGEHKFKSFVKLSSKEMKRNKTSNPSSSASPERLSRDKVSNKAQLDDGEKEEWNCDRCTMLNPPENTVCFMCASTRGLEQPAPPQAGSRVCNGCTFNNKEGAKVCEVCHKTLYSTLV